MDFYPEPPLFLSGLILFARLQSGKSTRQVADDLEVTYQYFWDIENGFRKVSLTYVSRILPHINHTSTTFLALLPAYMESLKDDSSPCAKMILARLNAEKLFNKN